MTHALAEAGKNLNTVVGQNKEPFQRFFFYAVNHNIETFATFVMSNLYGYGRDLPFIVKGIFML